MTNPVDVAPAVGGRVLIDGIEYIVTRTTVQSKGNQRPAGSAAALEMAKATSSAQRPTRAQIDLIPVAEVERRMNSLGDLLDGIASDGDL